MPKRLQACNKNPQISERILGLQLPDVALGLDLGIFKIFIDHNNTTISCTSSCCLPRRRCTTLNGANGEATNKDDVKGKVNTLQNKRLARLERELRALALAKRSKSSKRKGKKTRAIPKPRPPSTFGGVPDINFEPDAPLQRATPVQASVLSQVAPFRVPRCMASILKGARPSQKITSRALASSVLTTSGSLLFNFSPCIASDGVSMMCIYYPTGGQAQNWADALNAANTKLTATTNTPYTESVLTSGDYKWRLVSFGVRIRNTTAPVQRQGVVRYLVDYGYDLLPYSGLGTQTLAMIASDMSANHKTVRVNTSTNPTIEIAVHATRDGDWVGEGNSWYCKQDGDLSTASGSTYYTGPLWVHVPAPSAQQTFDIEIIEHWEIAGSAIETLHTPSPTHGMAADTIRAIAEHSHHQHALQPHLSFSSVVKGAVKLEHNKEAMKDASIVGTALALL